MFDINKFNLHPVFVKFTLSHLINKYLLKAKIRFRSKLEAFLIISFNLELLMGNVDFVVII